MFKLFKKKRGSYRTPKQKADEEKYRVDAMLTKIWFEDLKAHPGYAREIARQRFGLSPEPEGEYSGEAPPDLLEVLKQAREAKDLIKDELGEKSSIWAVLPDIMKALPGAIQGLQQLQGQQGTRQITEQRQIAEQAPPPESEPKTGQEAIKEFAGSFLAMAPEEAAQELFEHKDEEGTIHALIWNTLLESDVDKVMEMMPMLNSMPEYQFLTPYTDKLSTNKGKLWLGLLIDEIKRLNAEEIGANVGETETKPTETEANVGETDAKPPETEENTN